MGDNFVWTWEFMDVRLGRSGVYGRSSFSSYSYDVGKSTTAGTKSACSFWLNRFLFLNLGYSELVVNSTGLTDGCLAYSLTTL